MLSFSSTVVTAVDCGAILYPYPPPIDEQVKAFAKEMDAQIVWGRAEAARFGGHSLSPLSFTASDKRRKFVVCSLNGAACVRLASSVPALLIGCLLNAAAAAEAANRLMEKLHTPITVVPCGEKWTNVADPGETFRPAIEDFLGAGAILSRLNGSKSPEAEVCIGAYRSLKDLIGELVWDSASGRELRERGYGQDVKHSIRTDASSAVPILERNRFIHVDA
ncbi:2-phosphosulfolactate phosphatase [Paenibacillus humicola]|uniref:2-phosphosulfolactate phosphatase n=1 Tax=Paenibacillus humicola TaxID=3110540 RepID=UPI00237AC34A|nr:2-phosphosulfolactate phosphatase [Paenibacillus humicola]